jgi:hypothetical protein
MSYIITRNRMLLSISAALLLGAATADAQSAVAPKLLFDPSSPTAAKQLEIVKVDFKRPDAPPPYTSYTLTKTSLDITTPGYVPGAADHPGIHIYPAEGSSWDLSQYGHIDAKVTNTGDKVFGINLHVIGSEGYWTEQNSEFVNVPPGESRIVKVIFGNSRGFRPIGTVDPSHVTQLFFYLYHTPYPHSFRIENIVAGGEKGEKPDPPPAAVAKP